MPLPDKPTWPSRLSEHDRKALQRALNRFYKRSRIDVAPLIVDGDIGAATRKRIRDAKWLAGYTGRWRKNTAVHSGFLWRLEHPRFVRRFRDPRKSARDAALVARGGGRRRRRRQWLRRNRYKARARGVGSFDGKPCANWLVPYLRWARDHGWDGQLNSGWRDPEFSERLCFEICGRPVCPGRCAGKSSNHVGSDKPRGAVDVSDYVEFGNLMKRCPLEPRIFNALGPADPVHFSATGR